MITAELAFFLVCAGVVVGFVAGAQIAAAIVGRVVDEKIEAARRTGGRS